MKWFIGIDPDLHHVAVAWITVDDAGSLVLGDIHVIERKKRKGETAFEAATGIIPDALFLAAMTSGTGGVEAVAVEGQRQYPDSKVRPNDLIALAQVAGAATAFSRRTNTKNVRAWLYMPLPQDWKGQVPKKIHQARVLRRVGLTPEGKADYCFPKEKVGLLARVSDWKHASDAVGLALYAYDTWKKEFRR